MKALLFEPNQNRRALLSFYLKAQFHITVFDANTLDSAKQLLKQESNEFDFICCDFANQGRELMRHYLVTCSPIHFIAWSDQTFDLSESKQLKNWIHFVRLNDLIPQISKEIGRYFKEALRDSRPESEQFSYVPVSLLGYASPLPGDLYLEARDKPEFSQIVPKGQPFGEKEASYFQARRNITQLSIRTKEVLAFVDRMIARLMPEQSPNIAERTLAVVSVRAFSEKDLGKTVEAVQAMTAKLGFTPEMAQFTKTKVMETIDEVKNKPHLSVLLQRLSRDRDKYISSHSALLAHIACSIATQMDWTTDGTYQKLTLAAFLHDINLKNETLAALGTMKEVEARASEFSAHDLKDYKEHPMTGAELARKFEEVPPDVDVIIAQHHERPDGSGFPRGLTHTRIAPIASVFIVAHDFTDFILSLPEDANPLSDENLERFVGLHRSAFRSVSFRKVLAAIKSLQNKKTSDS